MSITIRGNYKSGYYDSRILKNRFEITTNEAVKRSESGTLVAIGLISTETPEGTPLMLVGDYDSNNIFIASSISVVADSVKTSRLFMQNVLKHLRKDRKDFKLNSRFANNFVDAFGPDIIAYLNKTSNADEIKEKFGDAARIGLMATTGTVKTGIYSNKAEEMGMPLFVPSSERQEDVMSAIYGPEGAKAGKTDGICREELMRTAEELVREYDCNVLILGCTELPLILHEGDLPCAGKTVFVIDPTSALARKVVAMALKANEERGVR